MPATLARSVLVGKKFYGNIARGLVSIEIAGEEKKAYIAFQEKGPTGGFLP